MGSQHSKHAKASKDPYRALVDQAASRINTQYPQGTGADQIAAAVPNGKEPLVIMFRKNEEGKYSYDQEFYDRPVEHGPRRPSGETARERDRRRAKTEREGRDGGGEGTQGDERAPAGLRGSRGGEAVYAPVAREGQRAPQAEGEVLREDGKHAGGGAKGGARGSVEVDRERQAWVRHKH